MTKRELVAQKREEILALAEKRGMSEPRLFGSVARGDDGPDSDIDFLIRREPGTDPFELIELKEELEELLGCRVDLLTEHPWMRERLRSSILRDAVPV